MFTHSFFPPLQSRSSKPPSTRSIRISSLSTGNTRPRLINGNAQRVGAVALTWPPISPANVGNRNATAQILLASSKKLAEEIATLFATVKSGKEDDIRAAVARF